jgi:hypothetical protein
MNWLRKFFGLSDIDNVYKVEKILLEDRLETRRR